MSLPATLNVTDPSKRDELEKLLKDAERKARSRQLRADNLGNYLRTYNTQLRADGELTRQRRQRGRAIRPQVPALRAAYQNHRLSIAQLPAILDDIQRELREQGLPAGEFYEHCDNLRAEFAHRAADNEVADLPNSAGVLLDRWVRARRQLDQVGLPDALRQAARSRLDEGALRRLRTANIGAIAVQNIREQWNTLVVRVARLAEDQRMVVKRRLFRRSLNAAVPSAESDLWLMTSIIFDEAGQTTQGGRAKLAVGWVVMAPPAAQNSCLR